MNEEIAYNLGIQKTDIPITKDFGFTEFKKSILALNRYIEKVDYCNIEYTFKDSQVVVKFKAVHVNEPTSATVPYSLVTFEN